MTFHCRSRSAHAELPRLLALTWAVLGVCACSPTTPKPTAPQQSPTLGDPARSAPRITGTVSYEDATPAAGATLTITSRTSGVQVAVVTADRAGRFTAPIEAGDYAFAVTAERGAIWVEKLTISADDIAIKLADECKPVAGRIVTPGGEGVEVSLLRHSRYNGDTFVTYARSDRRFSLCLPPGTYSSQLSGRLLSTGIGVVVPSQAEIQLQGHAASKVKSAPQFSEKISYDLGGLVADIERSGARLVGLGEATHGSAEFVTMRARLILELARRAQLRMVLLENDAIVAMALERYVNGHDIDLPKTVAALRFWTTDTYEFLRFLEDIRSYNLARSSNEDRIHIWGIDVQNTALPVEFLLSNALKLNMSSDDQALLQSIAPNRAKAVRQFTFEQRTKLDTLLSRLSSVAGSTDLDTQLAVAARSLAIQVGYMDDDDTQGQYSDRRDAGMAQLASFIMERTGVQRACLWAHNGHVTKFSGDGVHRMGRRLASTFSGRYYAVGFFLFEGSSRAWDAAGQIGVISHKIPPAQTYTVEGALMAVTGAPDVAWLSLRQLPTKLRVWFETPRFARELGAGYSGEDRSMQLHDVHSAFDALVVIRTVHDTSPTPTGVRRAKQ